MTDWNRVDRRRFLVGAGGAVLALPMLEYFVPRKAFAAAAPAPKRFVVFYHPHGRLSGNGETVSGVRQDRWAPRATTGPLDTMSPALAPLAAIKNEIVTIDNIDNLVRHTSHDADGHRTAGYTSLTCSKPTVSGSTATGATGPSIDFAVGQRLRAGAGQQEAIVLPAEDTRNYYEDGCFYGLAGTDPATKSGNPREAIVQLFGAAQPQDPPPAPTLKDRLKAKRGTILDAVAKSFMSLRTKVNAADRERLDQHADFIERVSARFTGGGGGVVTTGCTRPDENSIQEFPDNTYGQANHDDITSPAQVENVVQALACDVVRVASLRFWMSYDNVFPFMFPGGSPFQSHNYHDAIHNSPRITDTYGDNLVTCYTFYAQMFTLLVQRLGQMIDTDGSRMLDNTLVLWASDMGYGSAHYDYNVPIVMAGLKSAFPQGQGRHLAGPRRSLGDVYAQVLRMFGGADTTFGSTGTVGDLYGPGANADNIFTWSSYGGYSSGYLTTSLNVHQGPLDL